MARARTCLTVHRHIARLTGHREPSATSRRASVDVFFRAVEPQQEPQEVDRRDG
jgi:hypothetical protein